ncbi:MAG TPA: UDP-3-O-(3-hydroxymyristoyl)glucosamine N-acyltransferase [Methylovirgula sp.]|nr:UDP-3-O-(3-hydroxymyristoyl)glucosamine N-acyltransferase [Methylovirgula sp.]
MSDPVFFHSTLRPTLAEIVAWTGATAPHGADLSAIVESLAPLEEASRASLSFFDNPKYFEDLSATRAMACFIAPRFAARVPGSTLALLTEQPARDFARVLAKLYPDALRPGSLFGSNGVSPGVSVHPDARIEDDVIVDPGTVIGPYAEIGANSIVGPNVVIGPNVKIGRNCAIGAGVRIANALIGNRVIVHAGAAIGQDGFGFVSGEGNHLKVPQVGRVILQDDVEIGANTTIDRGALHDTVIGEGTKIDNLVQIAQNVRIGRHCLIVAQAGISGSTELGDFVTVGAQAGFAAHLEIGAGAQIAAQAGVIADVPGGMQVGGTPARAVRAWLRGEAMLDKLAKGKKPARKGETR